MLHFLGKDNTFPPVEEALNHPNGLLAVGGDLSPERLLNAYRLGIFPWFNPDEPILWWSPDPRMVLFLNELKISKSLKKSLKKPGIEVRFDTAFRKVMEECALPRKGESGTWISNAMIDAYCCLHAKGYAHSVEVYQNGTLCAGLYGTAIGKAFFGESMFTHVTDGSKIALVHLVRYLQEKRYYFIDCQVVSEHLSHLGARAIPRKTFIKLLEEAVALPHDHAWDNPGISNNHSNMTITTMHNHDASE